MIFPMQPGMEVDCPVCSVPAGEVCRVTSWFRGSTHPERRKAANAMQQVMISEMSRWIPG